MQQNHKVGKFQMSVKPSEHTKDKSDSNRAKVITAWLLSQWDKQKGHRNHAI